MLAKARELGDTVEAFYAGGDADAVAGALGAHGATKVHATGDLGGALPGVPVAAAIAAADRGRRRARPHPVRHHLRRPRHRRPPVGEARQAGAHQQHRRRGRRRRDRRRPSRSSVAPQIVKTKFTAGAPGHRARSGRSRSWPRRAAAARPRSPTLAVPDTGAAGAAKIIDRHVEERTGPKLDEAAVVVSGGRGLGEAEQVRDDRGPGQAAQGRPGRVAGHRRRRLGALLATRSARPARS